MNIGLILMFDATEGQTPATVYEQSMEYAKLAEYAGCSTLWLTEHHGKKNRLCPSIPLMMSYLANHTKLELGAATILLSHYTPRHIAEEIGMLSNMYPHRFSFGFARGGNGEVELHDGGNESVARSTMLKHLDELKGYLLNSVESESHPKPTSNPPLFVASRDDDVLRYAAEHDMGIMAGHKWSLDEVEDAMNRYRKYHKQNKTPQTVLSRYFLIKDDNEKAIQKIIEDTAQRKAKNNKSNENSKNPLRPELLDTESLVGSTEKAKKMLQKYRDIGITDLALRQATFNTAETMESLFKLAPILQSGGDK